MEKLNNEFATGHVLHAAELNNIVTKVNELVDGQNSNSKAIAQKGEVKTVKMNGSVYSPTSGGQIDLGSVSGEGCDTVINIAHFAINEQGQLVMTRAQADDSLTFDINEQGQLCVSY